MNSCANKKENKKNKRYGIWAWVGAIYGPIIFWVLFVNLPKVEWKYVFESNKTKIARHLCKIIYKFPICNLYVRTIFRYII